MINPSDTLKRHQKLHASDGSKPPKRMSKPLKRDLDAEITPTDVTQSDRSTESSVDQSPAQEIVEPQLFYDGLCSWEYQSLDPIFTSSSFLATTSNDFVNTTLSNHFAPAGDETTHANEFTIDPESLWGI
jgi:hypothetical protein